MISILIPVFNRDINELVQALSKQLRLLNNSGEIIVMDDGSEPHYKSLNIKAAGIESVRYVESEANVGRIRIRQRLARTALYKWLLFLDCDSTIVSDQFLTNYCNTLTDGEQVIAGGRVYKTQQPTDCGFMLHWKYGTTREASRLANQSRAKRFMTNNFLISKTTFERFDFTGRLDGYGYEDTWMAIQLEAMQVAVVFIDNPVMHDGVETSDVFLKKSEAALHNLKRLSDLTVPAILIKHVTLYHYFYRFQSWKMLWIVPLVYTLMQRYVRSNLLSCKPSLVLFDLYRLNYFVGLNSRSYRQNN